MKQLLILLTLLLGADSALADRNGDVESVLDTLHVAASKAESETYFGLFSEDAIFIGTDVGEYWTLETFTSYVEPYFGRGQGWTYLPRSRDIRFSKSGDVAWFHEVLDSQRYGTSRGTGVLVLEEGKSWKIVQYHLTYPIPNELAVEITDRIKVFEAEAAEESQE